MAKGNLALVRPLTLRDDAKVNIVLGLQWKRIVSKSDDERAMVRELAKAAGSNYALQGRGASGGAIRIVGHGKIGRAESGPMFSAAYAFQVQHTESEVALVAIMLSADQVWVCAVAEGLVCHGFDVALNVEDAKAKVGEFFEIYDEVKERIVLYGDFFENSRPMTLELLGEYAAIHQPKQCVVEKVEAKASIPKPALIGLVLIIGGLLAKEGWSRYQQAERAKALAAIEAEKAPDMAPSEIWRKSLANWVGTTSIAGFKSIEDAVAGIGKLRTQHAGWHLQEIACDRKVDQWKCVATYQADATASATSQAFIASIGSDAAVTWRDLETANVGFAIPTSASKVAVDRLPKEAPLLLDLMSALQASKPAFSSVGKMPAFAAVSVPLIKKDDGSQNTLDLGAVKPKVVVADVSLAGPVRSVFALSKFDISWKSFAASLTPVAKPDIKTSVITFTALKGEIYAIKD